MREIKGKSEEWRIVAKAGRRARSESKGWEEWIIGIETRERYTVT